MNSIIIKGRLARDPEIRSVGSTTVCHFSVAVDREYQKRDEEKTADFFRCNAWAQQGEFVNSYFTKGQEILVRGKMESRQYTDKEGVSRTAWEIRVDRAEFCGSKKDNAMDSKAGFTDVEDEDIPF